MCRCNPNMKTPCCGKLECCSPGCQWHNHAYRGKAEAEPRNFGPDLNSIMYKIVDFADDVLKWHPGPYNPKLYAILKLAEELRPILASLGIKVGTVGDKQS